MNRLCRVVFLFLVIASCLPSTPVSEELLPLEGTWVDIYGIIQFKFTFGTDCEVNRVEYDNCAEGTWGDRQYVSSVLLNADFEDSKYPGYEYFAWTNDYIAIDSYQPDRIVTSYYFDLVDVNEVRGVQCIDPFDSGFCNSLFEWEELHAFRRED